MSSPAGLVVLALSIVVACVPTIIYVILIWRIDRYEREPKPLLAAAFLWGAVPAIVMSALIEMATDVPMVAISQGYGELVTSSLVAPPVEELAKGLALLGLFWLARGELDDVLDGIVYGSTIGFGFAMTENVFYFVGAWQQSGFGDWSMVVFIRAVAFGLSHATFTALTGIGVGLARFQRPGPRRWLLIAAGLAAATVAHLLHNFFLSVTDLCLLSLFVDWAGVLVILAIILMAWHRERTWIRTHLVEEVSLGVLTQPQFQIIASRRSRLKRQWALLGLTGLSQARLWGQLMDAAVELAFKKHQATTIGHQEPTQATIEELRVKIIRIRKRLTAKATAD